MLNTDQLETLTDAQRDEYSEMDDDERASFEYFYGFAHGTTSLAVVTNEEVEMYKKYTDTVTLKAVWQLCGMVPHKGQQDAIYTFDTKIDTTNSYVIAAGRRYGKSVSLSIVAIRELLIPFSATILVCPTFANSRIIFTEVLKLVKKLGLEIDTINRGQFNFTLTNGSRFTANSSANIESALGGKYSLALYEEFQSISNAEVIHKQMIAPTLLDFGTRPSGILYGRQFFIGTSRGIDNQLYDYFCMEQDYSNWKSFTSPSWTNPTLPKSYFDQMRIELGDMLFAQEIEAKFIGMDKNVFYAYDPEINLFDPTTTIFNRHSVYVVGIDIGWSDSTAGVWIHREGNTYYVSEAYSEAMRATKEHVDSYIEIESKIAGKVDMRYGDPAAAQTLNDYIITYDYMITGADNPVNASIQYINQLLAPTGLNHKPRLYISKELTELQRQLSRVRFKPDISKGSKDPYIKDPKGTHWDLIAALRYAIYSDRFNIASVNILQG